MSTPMSGATAGGTATQQDRLSVSTSTAAAPEDGGRFGPSTDVGNASVGDLVTEVLNDLSTLMRKEIELAKAEVRHEATKAGKGIGMLTGAAIAGWFTLMFLSMTVMWLIAQVAPVWVGAFVITLLWGIGAAVLAVVGRNKLRQVNPVPEQTVESLKEDVQWAKGQSR